MPSTRIEPIYDGNEWVYVEGEPRCDVCVMKDQDPTTNQIESGRDNIKKNSVNGISMVSQVDQQHGGESEAENDTEDDTEDDSEDDNEDNMENDGESEERSREEETTPNPYVIPVITHGQLQVQSHVRDSALGRRLFVDRLRLLGNKCTICQMLGINDSTNHGFEQCSNRKRYLDSKGRVIRQQGGDWFAHYSACYECYLAQDICPKQGRKVNGVYQCEFRDRIGPMTWAAYQSVTWREEVLSKAVEAGVLLNEERYMEWLGKKRRYWGMEMSNMCYIATRVLEVMFVR
jgi:hypothetical protein